MVWQHGLGSEGFICFIILSGNVEEGTSLPLQIPSDIVLLPLEKKAQVSAVADLPFALEVPCPGAFSLPPVAHLPARAAACRWATIAATTLTARACLSPITLYQMRSTARMSVRPMAVPLFYIILAASVIATLLTCPPNFWWRYSVCLSRPPLWQHLPLG